MSHQAAGNSYLPFVDLMRLETINDVTFRSTAQPFCPGGNHPRSLGRAYGGHVFAQAAWAAAQTVGEGFVLHHITGSFILPGLIEVPFIYTVHTIRDGRSYSTRIVNVTQARGKGICFTCTCSFKTAETSSLEIQQPHDLRKEYASVLSGKYLTDFPEAPGMDVPFYWEYLRQGHANEKFPGLTTRKVDMSAYNQGRDPLDKRQLIFYSPIGDLPRDANLHACAHLYASDRNSLYIAANHLGVGGSYVRMGSLVHTVVFHAGWGDLWFGQEVVEGGEGAQGNWFCKEDWTDRAAVGRSLFHSRVWSPRGKHVVTILQDGMIRVGERDGGGCGDGSKL